MMEVGLARVSRIIALMLMAVFFCPFAYSKTIFVDDDAGADYESIQAGIDAAENGDTVSVAPGIYYENVVMKNGISLSGAGADVTIIDANGYGDVVDARANDVTIIGFTLRNSGQFDSGHMNCGVYIGGNYATVIRNNIIAHNEIGIGVWDGANPDIRNNIIKNNYQGLYIYGREDKPSNPCVINNTIVNNEAEGITLRVTVSPFIVNNIITGHAYGINQNYVTGSPTISYNNLWLNDVNYLRDNRTDDTLAGPGSISVDPYFVDPGYWVDTNDSNDVWVDGDYHLKSQAGRWDPNSGSWIQDDVTSPCIDTGDPNSPLGHEPFPNGVIINMGAYGGTVEASKSPSGLHAKYGGAGEPNDPYLIYTAEHMNTIGLHEEDWDKHFKLMDDIDLSGYSYETALIAPDVGGDGYTFPGTPFSGVFDGNGHAVSNLTITGKSYLGLFGRLGSGAEVMNLGVVDVNITGSYYAIGGLVGDNFRGSITSSYSTGTITGYTNVGGLVGYNQYGDIATSYSTAAVGATFSGNQKIGGFVGVNAGRTSTSYCTGPVTGQRVVGGFAGYSTGNINMCYSTGQVGGDQQIGGFLGDRYPNSDFVSDCFWDVETSGVSSSAGGTGITTAEMQTDGTFLEAGWDFVDETVNGAEDIWWILEGQDYPKLWWELIGD